MPDPRLDAILERVRALDDAGHDADALAVLERVAQAPPCPPLLWAADQATAMLVGIANLTNATEHRWLLYSGIPVAAGGAGLAVITALWFALDGYCSAPSCTWHARYQPDERYAGAWTASGVLVVAGLFLILGGLNVFTPSALDFNMRRDSVISSLQRRRLRGVDLAVGSPVFDPAECE